MSQETAAAARRPNARLNEVHLNREIIEQEFHGVVSVGFDPSDARGANGDAIWLLRIEEVLDHRLRAQVEA